MSLKSRRFACLAPIIALFVANPALGQQTPPDALEQPYGASEPSVRPPPPPPPPPLPPPPAGNPPAPVNAPLPPPQAAPTVAPPPPPPPPVSGVVEEVKPADTRPHGPVRARRRIALTGEVGWNGLAGFGPVLGYHVDPHLTFEFGAGISLTGFKGGLRARYNLATGPVTPFIGAGFLATGGLGVVTGSTQDSGSSSSRDDVTIRVGPSRFIQAVGGIDWTSPGGFTLVGTFGWCALLNDNLDILAGKPTVEDLQAFDIIFRSGPVIAVSTGYTF